MSVPLTRLGGRAFTHARDDDNDVEREYDRLRDLARAEAQKRNDCFERSRQAYDSGDGAGAKALSNEGKGHAARMDDYNRQASEYIFRENNGGDRVAADTVDLHGQFVDEAERIVEARVRAARAQGQTHLHVIVGKGNHSANHVQKIKPRVEHVCRELGLQCRTEENAGRIYINLTGGAAEPPPLPPPDAGYGHGGGGGGGGYQDSPQQHHGGQQHHHGGGQHHQPPPHGDVEGEPLEKKVLHKIVRKLADCCVIM